MCTTKKTVTTNGHPDEPEAEESAVSHFQVLMFHHITNILNQRGRVKYKREKN